MSLAPLLAAPLAVQLHVATVVPAALLGGWLIWASRKGSVAHRALGTAYLLLMTVTSLTAVFIGASVFPLLHLGRFALGPVHLFVVLTLSGVWNAVQGLRVGDFRRHGRAVRGTYFGGLMIAGAFTLLPGRIMHAVVFG